MGEEGDIGEGEREMRGARKCKSKLNEDWDGGDNVSPTSQCSSDWSD